MLVLGGEVAAVNVGADDVGFGIDLAVSLLSRQTVEGERARRRRLMFGPSTFTGTPLAISIASRRLRPSRIEAVSQGRPADRDRDLSPFLP